MPHKLTLFTLAIALLLPATLARGENEQQAFEAARKLEQAGKTEQAFLAYLTIPGAQHEAVRIGRPEAAEFLALLREKAAGVSKPLAKAVEGDLLLALGKRDEALACYRAAAACVGTSDKEDWASGHIPAEAYLVEPPATSEQYPFHGGLIGPFAAGPGSHRDNWLLRRFIALESWDDAEREFARVWQIHRRNARPYRVMVPVYQGDGKTIEQPSLVRPSGFNGKGLQFALDYAFFLKKRQKNDQALKVIGEPLMAIDMDRNPNRVIYEEVPAQIDDQAAPMRNNLAPGYMRHFYGLAMGVSRKEFVRLAFGVFKTEGKEEELIDGIEKRIRAGENRLRRVLGRIRFHQGKTDEALALELKYIAQGDFDPLTVAYRRGLAFEEASKLAEAVEAYEQALLLPYTLPQLPDRDEEAVQASMMSQMAAPMPGGGTSASRAQFQAQILGRLHRLYGALGQPEKVFETTLRQFEVNPALLANFDTLVQAGRRADVLGRQETFKTWLKKQVSAAQTPAARANIYWVLKDYKACAEALADQYKANSQSYGYAHQQWVERFREAGREPLRTMLTTLLEADPTNARARLELLNLSDRLEGPEVIAAFESLLETDASFAFARGKGAYNRTQFRNYFDLAYRLMRLYEKEGQLDKLQTLGLRLAKGEKPFGEWWTNTPSYTDYRDDEGMPEDVNPCLALLIHRADAKTLAQLDDMWKARADFPAKRQLARRLADSLVMPKGAKDVGWANLPDGVRLIASNENVLSLARDEKHVYAGHPWGVAVYDLQGKPITRVALGEAARAMAVIDANLWVGTPKGLFRVNRDDWTLGHIWLHGDVPAGNRYGRSFPGTAQYWFDNGVYTLARDGEDLWIGLHRNVQRLNTRTMSLRAYSYHELGMTSWGGTDWILPDGEYTWACSRHTGLRRYDRNSDTWETVEYGERGVGLIGIIDDRLFGHVWLNDQLRDRPCLIDRDTLKVTPLLIEGNLTEDQRMINGPFCYYGTYRGQLVFGPGNPGYVFDEAIGKLRPIGMPWDRQDDPIESILPEGYRGGQVAWMGPTWSKLDKPAGATLEVRQSESGAWVMLIGPDDLIVVGKRQAHGPRYEYPHEDWPYGDIIWDKKDDAGGLHFISPDGTARRVSDRPHTDAIRGDNVFSAVADPAGDRIWLCTDLGLAPLDAAGRVTGRFSHRDGLCCNRVTSALTVGDKLLFSTAWGDHGGGLGLFDPATRVFTARFQPDGLATNKLDRIEPVDGRVRLVYDVEYGRGGPYRYRQFPPGEYDPTTHDVTTGGEPANPSQNDANKRIAKRNPRTGRLLPYLGGFVIAEKKIGGKTYLCGTRGLVILDDEDTSTLQVAQLEVELVTDPEDRLREEANRATVSVGSPEDLEKYLASKNPFIRVKALCEGSLMSNVPAEYIPLLSRCVDDPHLRVRSTAIFLLSRATDASAMPALERALKDRDAQIRAVAALALTRLGRRPSLACFEEMLTHDYGNMPYNVDSLIGVQAGREKAYVVLAQHADAEVFALLMKYPPYYLNYDYKDEVYPPLGAALNRHPEVAGMLLTAYDGKRTTDSVTYFAQHVFGFAGKEMLPILFEALTSDDRVVRSNAARGCGAIGEESAVPRLIEALDLESGLSRGSIVWALGELKAEAALPHLVTLYIDARNDERRRAGSGFRAAQAAAVAQSQFQQLRDSTAIDSEWNELQAIAGPAPIDPRRNEPLLSPEMILEAVRKIGPAAAQEFYRKLAAEADTQARHEAAERLAECGPDDAAVNLPILRNLLADEDLGVRIRAAVSLLILGQKDVEKQILTWLGSSDRWVPRSIIFQLCRVEDGRKLVFARKGIEQAMKSLETYDAPRAKELLERIPQ